MWTHEGPSIEKERKQLWIDEGPYMRKKNKREKYIDP